MRSRYITLCRCVPDRTMIRSMMWNDSSGLDTCIPELDMHPLLFLVLVLGGKDDS